MSMNKFMHPRNTYKTPPNFKQLALEFPDFKPYVKLDITGKTVFDFKNREALKALSCVLLKKDFDLDVEIPKTKLIPTIPLRLNYILWIEDLLSFIQKTDATITGLDIGTGASCVYPLLASKKNGWSMLATDINEDSVRCAEDNVKRNKLEHLVKVIKVSGETLLKEALGDEDSIDFCMCNPPFFSSTQELHPFFKSRKSSRPRPKNAFVAQVEEVVSKGGEIEFVQRIIKESQELESRVKIYTTMVGQKSDLPALKKSLREAAVRSFKETEFCQGNTTRWGLAWTYLDYDLQKMQDQAKLANKPIKTSGPLTFDLRDQDSTTETLSACSDDILRLFKGLNMTFDEVTRNKLHHRYFVTAYSNTWSNQRRKRREQSRNPTENNVTDICIEKEELDESPKKRTLDDLLCESTSKKLRLSTDSESSEHSAVFYKFMCGLKLENGKIVLELNTLSDFTNRDYLHQIMQYVRNNYKKQI